MKSAFLATLAALLAATSGLALARAPAAPAPWTTLRDTAPLPPLETSGRLSVGDAEMYYATYGKGPPVILLHPGLGYGDYWANQVGPLSQEYRVIVVDLRAHGRSTGSAQPLSYELMAEDVVRLIKTLKLRDPVIVGWGDGAVVGLEIARRFPKRIGKLVAFGLTWNKDGLQPSPDQQNTFIEYVNKAMADYQRIAADPQGFTVTLDHMEALWEREPNYTAQDLAKLKTPTTILVAQYDEWVAPEHQVEAAGLIPNANLVVIPKASYFAPWQAPKKFNDALWTALRR